MARSLEMIEKGEDHWRIHLLEIQLGWLSLETSTGKLQQQFKGICIRFARIVTGSALQWQTLLEECRDMRCNRGHDIAPAKNDSQQSAIPFNSSGVASRYQYV